MPKGIEYLRGKLAKKRARVKLRYRYYNAKYKVNAISPLIPPEYRWLTATLGWCGKTVDTLADRLAVNKFRNDTFGANEIFTLNNSDILYDSAILSALVSSCCFIYISADETGYPRLQVIDGGNATGILNPITYLLDEGYAVLERNADTDAPTLEAYFTPEETVYYPVGAEPYSIKHSAGVPLLVPIIYRPDADRLFGHSRITRTCMSLQDEAIRTLMRSEVSAEFYSFPQKYILGLSDDADFNGRAATMSSFLSFGKDEDGDRPVVGQFTATSMSPHIEQIKMFAALFAGESGLNLDDLGFVSNNPMSAEAIKASHDMLSKTAEKAQHCFSTGFINTAYVACCLRDSFPMSRNVFAKELRVAWKPIFKPDASMLSGLGDAILKIQNAKPDLITDEALEDLLGF